MSDAAKIIELIQTIGKIEIKFNQTDEYYYFNGSKVDYKILRSQYLNLYREIDKIVAKQFNEDGIRKPIKEYRKIILIELKSIKKALEQAIVNFLHYKRANEISHKTEESFIQVKRIIVAQQFILKKMYTELDYILNLHEFPIDEEYEAELPASTNLKITRYGKAAFKLGKKEVAMLFYLLEKSELISFENHSKSNIARNYFIENNFQYSDERDNNIDEPVDLIQIAKEFSNLKSHDRDKKKLNKKTRDNLIQLLTDKLKAVDI